MTKQQHLDWDDFRLVKIIAEASGLAGAAERLGVNHSTVFRRLGQMEEGLGVKLFERHRTGYVLTPAGEEMAALAEQMEENVTSFTRKLAGQAVAPAGELRVTTNDTLLVHLLTPIFSRFLTSCPEMRLDVVLANQALNLSKRDADVAIRATDSPPETLVGRRAATIAWAIYGRAVDFPDPIVQDSPALYARPWVALGDNLSTLKAARYVRERVAPELISYRVNTVLGLAEAVEAGVGIGPLPCFIADAKPNLVRLSDINPDFSAGLWLLTHPDLRQSARVRAFMDFMATEIGKQKRWIEGSGKRAAS
ncbi:LysR family transcriptional regulator [Microvirga aerophila]|jgi:DNA-binding transcriptional LysR family regulator|uniref:LysR family transcriptional regulator n=1 Tax=Microvirga aerophila TaxID=670291 RepID=A0A512BME1_9HYPH|nr:LysR family transcriptional regulator [Microvirga aerophila]GEO13126.1 LysR family transcriptional regulator [Microvirga aerophila]